MGEDRLAYNRQNELRAVLSGDGLNVRHHPPGEATKGMLEFISKSESEKGQGDPDRGELWLEWMRWWPERNVRNRLPLVCRR